MFGQKRLNQITRQQIQSFHTDLLATGLAPATCDHFIKLIKHAFNLAIDWGLFTEKNPAARIPLFGVDNRIENLLTDEELDRLVTVLRTDLNRPVCLIALLLLSTGARLNEALQAKWSHINREQRQWHVPMHNSKSKKGRWVPLNASAMMALDEIGTEGKYEHIFVNRKNGGKPYTNVAKVWTRLRKKAKLPHLRIHDLRHGFATMLASSGRSLIEIGQLLGHSRNSSSITLRYIHLAQGVLHDASNVASLKIMGTARATPPEGASIGNSVISKVASTLPASEGSA